MKMTSSDITTYPKFANYVKNDLPNIISNTSIVRAMQVVGQLNRASLISALTWGSGPDIKISPLAGACGEYTPGSGSNEIRIDKNIVLDFEAGRGRKVARAGNVYLVGATLLHELVHWGDDKDGIDRPGEEGEEYERLVYGSVIPCP